MSIFIVSPAFDNQCNEYLAMFILLPYDLGQWWLQAISWSDFGIILFYG